MELTDEQLQIIADKVVEKLAEREIEVNQSRSQSVYIARSSRRLSFEPENYLTEKAGIQEDFQPPISISEDTEEKQKTHFSLNLSLEENEILEIIAKKKNETKNQVLREAIALMNLAVQARELGYQLGIGKEGYIDTEIVGL